MRRVLTLAEAHALRNAAGAVQSGGPAAIDHLLTLVALLESDGARLIEVLETALLTAEGLASLQSQRAPKRLIVPSSFFAKEPWASADRHAPSLPRHQSLSANDISSWSASILQSETSTSTSLSVAIDQGNGRHAGRDVLLLLGDQHERRLDLETSTIRRSIPSALTRLHCEVGAHLVDIKDLLDQLRPRIVHVTAHADEEGLYLTRGAERDIVAWERFIAEIEASVHRPELVILNSCRSLSRAQAILSLGVKHVVAVDGRVPIECARLFADVLYASFASFDLARSAERAKSAIKTAWPGITYHVLGPSNRWFAPWTIRTS